MIDPRIRYANEPGFMHAHFFIEQVGNIFSINKSDNYEGN